MEPTSDIRSPPPLPLRMLVQWVYCPRLFHFMHIQGQMEANAHVWRGRYRHKAVDQPSDKESRRKPPVEDGTPTTWRRRTAMEVGSVRLGLIGKLDGVLFDESDRAVPTELKSGAGPDPEEQGDLCEQGAWIADAIHVMAQALLLEDCGHVVPAMEVYYAGSRRLVRLDPTPQLRDATVAAIAGAKAACGQTQLPPPVDDARKCVGCSMVTSCMPEETRWLNAEAHGVAPPKIRQIAPARVDEQSVTVTLPRASVHKDGDALRFDVPADVAEQAGVPRKQRIALAGLREVCLVGSIQVTTEAMIACADAGVQISWLSPTGRVLASLTGGLGNNVQLRMRQHRIADDPARALALSRTFIDGKIRNQRTLIRRNLSESDAAVDELSSLVDGIAGTADHSALLGIEGRASRVYFEAFSRLLVDRGGEAFAMNGRSRRPPTDPTNAMLSFGYAVLTKDVTHIVQRVGFDPMIGFLHGVGYGRPALALDLLEEFRALIVDSAVLNAVSRKIVTADDFTAEGGGVVLGAPARRAFLGALDQRKEQVVAHPRFGTRVSYLRMIELQARLLSRVLEGEIVEYVPMSTR